MNADWADPELREMVREYADRMNLTLTEAIAALLVDALHADHIRRNPEFYVGVAA